MAVFIGTFENKVDRKGRVSVPAPFRQALTGQSWHGIVAFRSYRAEAVEACGMDFIERLNGSVADLDFFSERQDDLATSIFADSQQLAFDGEGRILLPEPFVAHAGIDGRAAFVGMGSIFQIWEPARLEAHKANARQRAREQKLTLSLRPAGGGESR